MSEGAWRAQAACRFSDVEVFFPPGEAPGHVAAAQNLCRDCLVSLQCLAYAVATRPQFGIWCGRTSEEIRRLNERHPDPRRLVFGADEDLAELASEIPEKGSALGAPHQSETNRPHEMSGGGGIASNLTPGSRTGKGGDAPSDGLAST